MPDADLRQLERVDRQRWLVERYRRGLFTRDDLVPGDRVVCVQYWEQLNDTRINDYRNGMAGTVVGLRGGARFHAGHEVYARLDREYRHPERMDLCHLVKPEGA